MKKYPEALSYLSAVSESVPCYEQALSLIHIFRYEPEFGADSRCHFPYPLAVEAGQLGVDILLGGCGAGGLSLIHI